MLQSIPSTNMARNRHRPRHQRKGAVVGVPGPMHLQKCLLDQIVGLGAVARLREQIAPQRRGNRRVDLVEGLEAARLIVAHQLAKAKVFCHELCRAWLDRISSYCEPRTNGVRIVVMN